MQAKKVSNFNGLRLLGNIRSTNSTKTQRKKAEFTLANKVKYRKVFHVGT